MRKITCPNDCDRSEEPYPFYYPACCLRNDDGEREAEMGIYCDEDLSLSNTWADGTRGVVGWYEDDCFPHCSVCNEETYRGPEEIECTYNRFDPSSYGCECGTCERVKHPDA